MADIALLVMKYIFIISAVMLQELLIDTDVFMPLRWLQPWPDALCLNKSVQSRSDIVPTLHQTWVHSSRVFCLPVLKAFQKIQQRQKKKQKPGEIDQKPQNNLDRIFRNPPEGTRVW